MFLKKVLNQPNLVGTVMIALLVCSGFVYAFAFDGFNIETATGGEVEAWLAQAGDNNYGGGGEACACDTSNDGRKRCDNCGNREQVDGQWQNPCKDKTKQYPCSNKCEARNSHSGSKPDCSCANNPYGGHNRSTWQICKNSTSNACKKKYTKNRKCTQGKT